MGEFLKSNYRIQDISIKQIDHVFISKFSDFLKLQKICGHNTTIKFLQKFKRILLICKHNGWLLHDPFTNIKLSLKEVQRPYLTEEELQRIIAFNSPIERLKRVKDFFLFACFTGLAYIDVKQLKKQNIEVNENGIWIRTFRQKSEGRSNIPLLEIPKNILYCYSNLELLNDSDLVLPILSNQKLNGYLKEIADLCAISKDLTFHVARHTFATTVTMMNGVPIESVSKMLGHKKIATTQHYARIVDQKVGEDMNILAQKIESRFVYKH
jgi:site-specific recombinase XerD